MRGQTKPERRIRGGCDKERCHGEIWTKLLSFPPVYMYKCINGIADICRVPLSCPHAENSVKVKLFE